MDTAAGFVQMVAHGALGGPDLLVAARRMTERHPRAVPLWWAAARLVMAADPRSTAQEILAVWGEDGDWDDWSDQDQPDAMQGDPDPGDAMSLPAVVTAVASSSQRCVLGAGEATRLEAARIADRRISIEVPVGRSLDDNLLGCVLEAAAGSDWSVVPVEPGFAVRHLGTTAPHARGLLRRSVI